MKRPFGSSDIRATKNQKPFHTPRRLRWPSQFVPLLEVKLLVRDTNASIDYTAAANKMLLIVRSLIVVETMMIGAMVRSKDILVRFGEHVRRLRKAKGLSQEGFAHECGLDRTYVGGIERGERNVALRNIERLAKSLGVSISELTKGL